MSFDSLTTPALLVDGRILVDNIEAMAQRARTGGVELWPHAKTHKSVDVARLQLEAGASGLTVATLREAECFASAGVENLLLAHSPVGFGKLERVADLATDAQLRVVVDNSATVHALTAVCRDRRVRVPYLWEVDCGVGRSGTSPGKPTAAAVKAALPSDGWVTFDGLLAFAGHVYRSVDALDVRRIAGEEVVALVETAHQLGAAGVECRVLSIGTTPTCSQIDAELPVTEIRPGNYVFHDATQVALGIVGKESCALSILGTVVSRPEERRLILDCGSKALAAERMTDRTPHFGFVIGHEELVVERLFEEHAILTSATPAEIPIGTRLRIVPNHACATVNLHDRMWIVEGEEISDSWPISVRGWEPFRDS